MPESGPGGARAAREAISMILSREMNGEVEGRPDAGIWPESRQSRQGAKNT